MSLVNFKKRIKPGAQVWPFVIFEFTGFFHNSPALYHLMGNLNIICKHPVPFRM